MTDELLETPPGKRQLTPRRRRETASAEKAKRLRTIFKKSIRWTTLLYGTS